MNMSVISLLLLLLSFGVVISTAVNILKMKYQNRPLSKGSDVYYIVRTFVMLPYWYIAILVSLLLFKNDALLSPVLFHNLVIFLSLAFVVFYIIFVVSEIQKRAVKKHINELISVVRSEQEIDDEDRNGASEKFVG